MMRFNIVPRPTPSIILHRHEEALFPVFDQLFEALSPSSHVRHLACDPEETSAAVILEDHSEKPITAWRFRWQFTDVLGQQRAGTISGDSYAVDIFRPIADPASRRLIAPSACEASLNHILSAAASLAVPSANNAIAIPYPSLIYSVGKTLPQVVFRVNGKPKCLLQKVSTTMTPDKRAPFFLLVLMLLVWSVPAHEQETGPTTEKYIALGRKFLMSLYPHLSGKNYALSISTAISYDHPTDSANPLELDIGEHPKDMVLGIAGGYIGEKPKDYQPGPIHPKQFLRASFGFEKGQLQGFLVSGSAVGNPDANDALLQLIIAHPEMTDVEANTAVKKAGAKYGLEDKEAFLKSLPLEKLEPFLGKLTVVSAEVKGLDEYHLRDSYWPNWTVLAIAKQPSGKELTVRMYFEPFKEDLVALYATPTSFAH